MKKIDYFNIFLMILFSFPLLAQNNFSVNGKIVEAGNLEPLIGAQITVESGAGTITDNYGKFTLIIPKGQHILTIRYLGYNEEKIQINQANVALGTIALTLNNTTLEEIVVSASPQNFKGNFKGSNYRIAPLAIKNINPLNTEEILRTIPGVNIVGDMGLSNRPNISIRGSWGRRSKKILLMEDGSPAAPAPYVAPGAYYNPVSDRVTSIEVYKGADMLRYGPNNMYGAVNYITALPPQKPELRVKLVGGQRNYKTGLLSYGGTWNNLGALVEGVYKKFDGFTDNSSVEVLNLNAKIFAKLSDNQSLYFKVSGQYEDNKASLSSQTPFTFETDPEQNPFDAEQFNMRRYGLDIIHKWLPKSNLSFTTKLYATDFERDWWRQITTKVKAADVRNYVGENIFNDRYSYLEGLNFDDEDYVIVGKVQNGRESAGDSRWTFTVSGFKETVNIEWNAWGGKHSLELGFKLHQEAYKDRFVMADSSRWARSGTTTNDIRYHLWSASGYIRNEFNFGKLNITPIARFEHIDMYRQNVLALSQNPNTSSLTDGQEPNIYNVFLPGVTIGYRIPKGEIFGSVYQGFIAPSKVFGFLVVQDGVVTNPLAGENINIKPELSLNTEIGWRGNLFDNILDGQLTYFNNTVRNFYAGGRNEVFETLGKINIQGLEMALSAKLYENNFHQINLFGNVTYLQSKLISGKLWDKDLFSQVIHNSETRQEYLNKVNANRHAYEIYVADSGGEETLLTNEVVTINDFGKITKSIVQFGADGLDESEAPYTPNINLTIGLNYDWKKLSLGISGHYVGEQYTEFNNFKNESADGAIGELPSFLSIDAFTNYDFIIGEKTYCNVFVNGKNITDNIYRASRLNRATSGVFPGGFRQIIFGINLSF